jgi:hypothetical protein
MTSYNTRPVPNDTLFMDLKTPRFLDVEDLTERWKIQSLDVEISRLAYEDTGPSMQDIDPATKKPRVKEATVLYFKSKTGKEYPRGMMIDAKENRDALRAATKAKTAGDLIGKRITIMVGEWRKKKVLRISPTPPAAVAPKPAQAQAPANGHNQPQPIEGQSRLYTLTQQSQVDLITAYTELWKAAGLTNEEAQATLKECGFDMNAAFNKIAVQYAPVIG